MSCPSPSLLSLCRAFIYALCSPFRCVERRKYGKSSVEGWVSPSKDLMNSESRRATHWRVLPRDLLPSACVWHAPFPIWDIHRIEPRREGGRSAGIQFSCLNGVGKKHALSWLKGFHLDSKDVLITGLLSIRLSSTEEDSNIIQLGSSNIHSSDEVRRAIYLL